MIGIIIGKKIKEARMNAKMTQAKLAKELGVHKNNIGLWEKGEVVPRDDKIGELAKVLNQDASWFYITDELPEIDQPTRQLQNQLLSAIQSGNDEILKKLDTLLKRTKLQDILEEKNGSIYNGSTANNSHAASTGELPNNVIPFPKNKTIPKFAQPIGAGYTLNGYHFDDVEGFFEMPLTRETRYIEAIAPVSGNSMYPEIHDGALVFIRPVKDFKDGDKLIVFLKESAELTLKYAFKVPPPKNSPQPHRGWISLQGFSDETKKIYEYRDVEIQGIVVDWVNDRKTVNEIIEKLKSVPQE